jgi:hypothetical protein
MKIELQRWLDKPFEQNIHTVKRLILPTASITTKLFKKIML